MKRVLAGGAMVFGVVAVVVLVLSVGPADGEAAVRVDVTRISPSATIDGYGTRQLADAALIMNAANALHMDKRAQQVGVMTAMGESSLRNIAYGDNARNPDGTIADSIGLFQQQSGWGSRATRLNPTASATLFFRSLARVHGWEQMSPTLAAHLVQVNADPRHYEKWWQSACDVVDYLGRTAGPR